MLILWVVCLELYPSSPERRTSQWWFQQHFRAHKIQGKHLNRFLKKDRSSSSKFVILLFFFLSIVFRIVTITAPRHAKDILLEKLFGCPSGPRLHVEPRVVSTAARLLMKAFAEFCCCVHANYSELGASVAFPSVDRRNR